LACLQITNALNGQNIVKPTAEGIASAARAAKNRGPAPVHSWDPPFCGDLDMRIARDGTWFYLGTPMGRPELVKLFANIIFPGHPGGKSRHHRG